MILVSMSSLLMTLCFVSYWLPQLIIPIIIRNSTRWRILDHPERRKVHSTPIPRLGGLSIAPALWFSCALCFVVDHSWPELFKIQSTLAISPLFMGLFLGSIGMFIVGAVDDTVRLRARHKFLGQFIVAALCVSFLPLPGEFFGLAINGWILRGAMILWLAIIPNSVNLLDGIDGLTATLGLIYAAVISIMAIATGQYIWLFATLPLSLSLLSFLKFNWSPGKIFLGDSGSFLIGFWIAYTSIYFGMTLHGDSFNWNPWISLGLTTIWIIDTVWAISRRYFSKAPSRRLLTRRSKKTYFALLKNALWNIANADDNHIHHRLLKAGFKVPQAVSIISATAGIFFLFSLTLRLFSTEAIGTFEIYFYTPVLFLGFSASATVLFSSLIQSRQKIEVTLSPLGKHIPNDLKILPYRADIDLKKSISSSGSKHPIEH